MGLPEYRILYSLRKNRSEEDYQSHLDEMTLKLVSELIKSDMDGDDDNVSKAIEDLIEEKKAEDKANAIYKLRREGHITVEVAANELGLSVKEYIKREDSFFS